MYFSIGTNYLHLIILNGLNFIIDCYTLPVVNKPTFTGIISVYSWYDTLCNLRKIIITFTLELVNIKQNYVEKNTRTVLYRRLNFICRIQSYQFNE